MLPKKFIKVLYFEAKKITDITLKYIILRVISVTFRLHKNIVARTPKTVITMVYGRTSFTIKGQQRIIPTYGKHQGVKLIGILNYETGHVHCIQDEKYDVEVFIKFLKDVLRLYHLRTVGKF